MRFVIKLGALLLAAVVIRPAIAQDAPSFSKDIKPFLQKYCLECHNGKKGKGEFDVTSYAAIKKGGISFPGFIPGNPKESFMLELVEHRSSPVMPPKKSKQPTAEEKKKLRDWIAAGAKDDSTSSTRTLPAIAPKGQPPAAVAALAWSPDGKRLAAAAHHDVAILDAAGTLLALLPGKTPATAIAYSKDGKHLAIARGSAGVAGSLDIHAVTPGANTPGSPVRTIAGHTDVIYSLAFSPDGKTIASAGYDRVIQLSNVETGQAVQTLKDHSDTIYGLAFSPDGKLLASAAADRAVKVWDVASGKRLYTLGDTTDWLYALAWSPDGKHLAGAGVDRSIRVWQVDAAGGKLVHSVFAHEGPVLRLAYAPDCQTLYSLSEDKSIKAWDTPTMVEKKVYARQADTPLALAVRPDGLTLAIGRFDGVLILVEAATGKTLAEPLPAKAKPAVPEQEPNDSAATGQRIAPTVTIAGKLDRAGDVDFYRFQAKAGQQVGVQVTGVEAAKLDAVLEVVDASGRLLADSATGVLGFTCEQAGSYAISIRDRDYRGGAAYQIKIGEVPVVTAVFPLGLPRGAEAEVQVEGVFLAAKTVRVKVPADAAVGSRIPIKVGTALGNPSIVVGEFAEVSAGAIPVPGTANGRLSQTGQIDGWPFPAKKGQRLIVEVQAGRIGSPLDSVLEIVDSAGKPVSQATLRSVALTYSTFRDTDSKAPGIRIESWNELAINDYLWVGNQLLRIKALPKNPDDDCQFFAVAGQRLGYLGTTPNHLSLGTPMYKVQIHPPGAAFPPNGFPVVALDYRNDDGGPGFGKDSRIVFDPPADGTYQVRIGDARGQGGPASGYRLTVRPPRPDFQVKWNPTTPTVWQGGAVPIAVTAERSDEFDDAIEIRLENLPPGMSAPVTTIPAGETTTSFALFADAKMAPLDKAANLKLVARARINGQEVVREVMGGQPKLAPPGDIVTATAQAAIAVKPGGIVPLTVTIERKNGFAGRVPVEVRGLPHGVRVLDIGLNGILITEKETTRTMRIYCEPWVEPTDHPIVVLARREGKNTEHAARSVLLKVGR